MAASVSSINGHALSGAVSQTGNNTQAEQSLYYFFPPMASGFTATGTVSLTYGSLPAGAYSLTAVATDNAGAQTTSAPVPITVGAAQAKLYFIHSDHLNTPRLISDDQQRTVWRWDNTDPFGGNPPDENPSGLGTFEFSLRFPGQYADKETNLHYNYFRDCYDPATGRYCQPDPIGLTSGSLSPYPYVYSSPLLLVDPTGEVGVPGLVVGAIIGGGAYAVGQVLSGNPISASGLLLNTLAGGISGASGAYIYAGVAKLGLNAVGSLALNAAGNAVVNVALNVPIQMAQNAQQGQCLANDLDVTVYRSAFYGAAGGYLGARIAGVAPTAAAAAQQYANRVGNTLVPKGPAFTGTIGPIGSAVAGGVNAAAFATGNIVQSAPTLFPNGRP